MEAEQIEQLELATLQKLHMEVSPEVSPIISPASQSQSE